jgi:hypothetical protein
MDGSIDLALNNETEQRRSRGNEFSSKDSRVRESAFDPRSIVTRFDKFGTFGLERMANRLAKTLEGTGPRGFFRFLFLSDDV